MKCGRALPGANTIARFMTPAIRPNADSETTLMPRRLRILVADDEHDTVHTLMQLLRDEGHDTRGVYNGGAVMPALQSFDADVVVLDIAMPDASGWEVARDIRLRYGQPRPLLIAISGLYKQSAAQILGTMAGFNHYIAKPYDPAALLALINRAL
jgi:DNA-binding response OmpR family regulator